MLLTLSVPADNDRGPRYAEQALAAIHQANVSRLPVTFSFRRVEETVSLCCRFPPELRAVIETQLAACYPEATLKRLHGDDLQQPRGFRVWSMRLWLSPDLFPIRRYPQFEDALNRNSADPVTGLLAAIAPKKSDPSQATIDLVTRPAGSLRVWSARRALLRLSRPFFSTRPELLRLVARMQGSRCLFVRVAGWLLSLLARKRSERGSEALTTSATRAHDREPQLQAAADKLGRHLFEVWIALTVAAPPAREAQAKAKLREMAAAFAQFSVPRLALFRASRIRPGVCRRRGRGFLLCDEELATLWHPATATVRAPRMEFTECRQAQPPAVLPSREREPDVADIGRVAFRERRERFGIRREDRFRHLAIVGKTGMGKSTLLLNMVASDIEAGRGVCLIDPHGDLGDAILDSIPKRRTNDVVLFDAGDRACPLAFNPLACPAATMRPLVASGVLSAFKKVFADSWGPRLEHILRNALLALLETRGTTLLSLLRILSDVGYQKQIVACVSDPVVRGFFENEFSKWKPNFRSEAIAPVQNKVGAFLSNPILRGILGQPGAKLDLRRVMDDGQILIVNLSKGRIGEDASALLGALLVSSLQLAAMSRANQPEEERPDFFAYIDEFQNFSTESFATILFEARKYRLSLTIANQYLAQMDDATRDAVFGNVGSLLAFQVGPQDAETLAEQFAGDVTPRDLIALPKFSAYARLLIDGSPSRPFSMMTLPPKKNQSDQRRSEIVRRTSRHRYAHPAIGAESECEILGF